MTVMSVLLGSGTGCGHGTKPGSSLPPAAPVEGPGRPRGCSLVPQRSVGPPKVEIGADDARYGSTMSGNTRYGVLFDIDGVLRIGTPRRQLHRLWALLGTSVRDRRSVLGMPRLIRALSADLGDAPVFYLTSFSIRLARPVGKMLLDDGYPAGTLLPTGRGFAPRFMVGGSRKRQLTAIERLAERMPELRWVLVGDDGGNDAEVFVEAALRHRDRIALIAARQVLDVDRPKINVPYRPDGALGAAVVAAPNAEELLPLARAALGVGQPRAGSAADWFLADGERGNPATRLRRWTEGNAVQPRVHGRAYFAALADALAATGDGDSVQFVGWRGDADQLLTDDGPTVGQALREAARRGVAVRGLLWHSHAKLLGYHAVPNRQLARAVTEAGGEVLLDQRVLSLGSHHQKMIVIRYAHRPTADVAFIGGIDLDHGSRDDADHRGDRQSVGADPFFGPNPAYHDLQLELHGPVVREAEEIFRERWSNPAAVTHCPGT